MRKWLRRIRGAIGMGFTWGAAWSGAGIVLAVVTRFFARAASLGWGDVLAVAPTFALACAVCASGSLAMARRAVRRDLPDSRGETAEAALTDHEKRKLLGNGD